MKPSLIAAALQSIEASVGDVEPGFILVAEYREERVRIRWWTAKADIDRLVQVGILKQLPGVSPKTYFAPQIFMVAYDQLSTSEGVDDLGG